MRSGGITLPEQQRNPRAVANLRLQAGAQSTFDRCVGGLPGDWAACGCCRLEIFIMSGIRSREIEIMPRSVYAGRFFFIFR